MKPTFSYTCLACSLPQIYVVVNFLTPYSFLSIRAYDVAKGGEAFAAGAKAYWDGEKATATAEGNVRIGLAVQAADAASPTVRILLNA